MRSARRTALALGLLAALVAPCGAAASGIQVRWTDDVPATATLLAGWLAVSAVGKGLAPSMCGWCGAPGPADRGVRSALLAPEPAAASAASNVMLYAVAPAFSLASSIAVTRLAGDRWIVLAEDLMLVAESFALASLVTGLVKVSVRRTRPYAFFGGDDPLYDGGGDDIQSFFSGHSSMTASIAASTATLAFLRRRPGAPWIAAAGASVALVTGILRISADRHYLSDVLAGLLVGAAAGILVPLLHLGPTGRPGLSLSVAPGPAGAAVVGVF